jgi:hypothetical protein
MTTSEQLRLRYIAVLGRHWRNALDNAGPTPALLDDLVGVAEDCARDAATRAATVIRSPARRITDTPDPSTVMPRTRTRTRGGEPA